LSSDKVVQCCCWTGGSVSAAVTFYKRCYVPGENIVFNAEINNNSRDDVTRIRATFKQVCRRSCRIEVPVLYLTEFPGSKNT